MENNSKDMKTLAQKFIKNMEYFIAEIYKNIKDETNIKEVLNNLDEKIKIENMLDLNFFFNNFHCKLPVGNNDYVPYLRYANFLYSIITKIGIKMEFIDKYWKFNNIIEKKQFLNYKPCVLDVRKYDLDILNKLKNDILNLAKYLKSLSPFFDGEKIIQLSKYLTFIK